MTRTSLGHILVAEGLLTERDRLTIRRESRGTSFARSILAIGLLDEEELAALLGAKTHFALAPKDLLDLVTKEAVEAIDPILLQHLDILPVTLQDGLLTVAVIDPLDRDTLRQLEFFSGFRIRPLIASAGLIYAGLKKFLPKFAPLTSAFEEFLKNHSIGAAQRLNQNQRHAQPTNQKAPPPCT